MSEVVVPARTHDRDLRVDRMDELGGARREAAVVRDLDDAEARRQDRRGDLALGRAADVAGQQDRHIAPAQLEHQRIVVPDFLPLPVGDSRMPGRDLYAVDPSTVTRVHVCPAGTRGLRLEPQRRQRVEARHGYAFPHF